MENEKITARESSAVFGYHTSWFLAASKLGLVRLVKLKPATFLRWEVEEFLSRLSAEELALIRAQIKSRKTPLPAGTTQVVGRGAKKSPGGEAED